MRRAIRSFPTPLSPVTSTLPSDVAARSAADMSACIAALATMNDGPEPTVFGPGPECESIDIDGSRPPQLLKPCRSVYLLTTVHNGSSIITPADDCIGEAARAFTGDFVFG